MKKQTDTPESITAMTARAALRRACKTRRKKEVAEGMGWSASQLSQFLKGSWLATGATVSKVKTYIKTIQGGK